MGDTDKEGKEKKEKKDKKDKDDKNRDAKDKKDKKEGKEKKGGRRGKKSTRDSTQGILEELIHHQMYLRASKRKPLFMLIHSAFVSFLWFFGSRKYETDIQDAAAGLHSYYAGTRFQLHNGCEDVRDEYWRYLTYQFTHLGLAHLLGNVIMQLIMGIPLEKFHGTIRLSV